MKKAIANLSFSDLKVRYFTGRSILISDTGQGKRYQYRNGCMTHPGFTGKVKSQIMHWNAMLQDFLMIRFGQIISRLTENTDQMFWIRRS